jgi:repressor LexA
MYEYPGPPVKELTPIQSQVLEFIERFMEERRMPPTVREIREHMGYRSDNAAWQHLQALGRKGVLKLDGRSRGITLTRPAGLPLVGRVAAGAPLLAQENIEDYLKVDASLFRPRADFLLRVQGMSMRDAGILDGDLLAVHRTSVAEHDQIVVARLGEEVTVKRFRQRGGIVTLLPENPDFEPLRIDLRRDAFAIEGRMAGLIRR